MQNSLHIMLVEDDLRLSKLIGDYLRQHGFTLSFVYRGDTALDHIAQEQPDLVILDLMLPGLDGLEVCKLCRQDYSGPILMLTAREDETDQIVGLEIGADDYVKKPVEPRVLLARVRALLRRTDQINKPSSDHLHETVFKFGLLNIDKGSRTVRLDGEIIDLTSNEFDLLCYLAENAGTILLRETLFNKVRGIDYDGLDRSIDIAVSRLRKKLQDSAQQPWRIKTVWGKGYLFVKDAWDAPAQQKKI